VGRGGLLLLFVGLVGCGARTGKVSGRVLHDGQPLPGGWVTFRPADPSKNAVSAELDKEGNYEALLPVGEVLVSVDNRELEPRSSHAGLVLDVPLGTEAKKAIGVPKGEQPRVPAPEKGGRYVHIPSKYYTAENSGLKFTVQGGDQKQDILLSK
jgi:hypothetical protein